MAKTRNRNTCDRARRHPSKSVSPVTRQRETLKIMFLRPTSQRGPGDGAAIDDIDLGQPRRGQHKDAEGCCSLRPARTRTESVMRGSLDSCQYARSERG